MASTTIRYFQFAHLPSGPMKQTSAECAELANKMDALLPDCTEKLAGMRKLLEAKDCFVRAAMDLPWSETQPTKE